MADADIVLNALVNAKSYVTQDTGMQEQLDAAIRELDLLRPAAACTGGCRAERGGELSNIWYCKIGEGRPQVNGADFPMRMAVREAYADITGQAPDFIFSGWGASLTESERAVVENRLPVDTREDQSRERVALLEAVALEVADMLHPPEHGYATMNRAVTAEAARKLRGAARSEEGK